MILDEQDLRNGTRFIVGTWQPDYVVNMFSSDLAHIPAAEFKSTDGVVFTAISFTFSEDHTLIMKNSVTGREVNGTWEQKSYGEFKYTLNGFLNLPAGTNESVAETLRVQDGESLVFSLGVIAIALKKVAEGTVSEEKKQDIGELPGDETLTGIVGTYGVYKLRTYTDAGFVWETAEELRGKEAAGTPEAGEYALQMLDWKVEFTADHQVFVWMKVPEGASQADLEEAIRQGEVAGVKDGLFAEKALEWKAVEGRYYYNTGERREVFGEVQSPWDELKSDEEGNIFFMNNMLLLKKQ
ncbi:MAG: hypothetical protein J5643_01400 [Lachnospiraceae bacterium]|nr:hypothetical protein [Lachnospiraceae bacterium]